MPKRRRSHSHSSDSSKSRIGSLFNRKKPEKKRRSAVRLDLSESSGGGSVLWSQKSNRWALVFVLVFLGALAVYFLREYDLSKTMMTQSGAKPLTTGFDYDLPAQLPVMDEKSLTPAPPPKERSRVQVAMEFQPKAQPAALQKTALALDAAKIGQHAQARVLIDEALALDPTYIGWHFYSGKVACEAGDWVRMEEDLQASIKKEEAVLPSLQMLGDMAFLMGQYSAAESLFRRAHTMFPEEPWFLVRLSQALRGRGEMKEAREIASVAATLPDASWAGAWVALADMEDGISAPENLAEMIAGNTTGMRAAWWLVSALAEYRQGRVEEAALALAEFNKMANEETQNVAALDPLVAKWISVPMLSEKLPDSVGFPRKKRVVESPVAPAVP
jgi:tetratricopeptide (TPR) repeat protein